MYTELGLDLTPTARRKMEDYIAVSKTTNKYGKHKHSLKIDKERVLEAYLK